MPSLRQLVLGLAVIGASGSAIAQQPTPGQEREISDEVTAIVKAMMAEAFVRACPDRLVIVEPKSAAHRALLSKGESWDPDQANEIAAQVKELRSLGCDRLVRVYLRNQAYYPSIGLAK